MWCREWSVMREVMRGVDYDKRERNFSKDHY